MPKTSISSLLVNRLINTQGNEKRATDMNKWKTTPIAFFPYPLYLSNSTAGEQQMCRVLPQIGSIERFSKK